MFFLCREKFLIVFCYLYVQRIFFLFMFIIKCVVDLSEGIRCYLEEFFDLEYYWDWNWSF